MRLGLGLGSGPGRHEPGTAEGEPPHCGEARQTEEEEQQFVHTPSIALNRWIVDGQGVKAGGWRISAA
jgi:hypothetical protein